MEVLKNVVTKGGEVASTYCTSPSEMITAMLIVWVVGCVVGYVFGRLITRRL